MNKLNHSLQSNQDPQTRKKEEKDEEDERPNGVIGQNTRLSTEGLFKKETTVKFSMEEREARKNIIAKASLAEIKDF